MPVKIVSTATNPESGVIKKEDMDRAIENFRENVSLTTLNGGFTVIKKHACWYAKNEILALLGIDPEDVPSNEITGLRIYFGVQPVSKVLACDKSDYSNMANTMLLATVVHDNELNSVGDFMLIPGYKAFENKLDGDCCGSMSGGNGNG